MGHDNDDDDDDWWRRRQTLVRHTSSERELHVACRTWFLSRDNKLTRDIDTAILPVCLSVCPWRSGIRWKRLNISSLFSLYGSPIILVLSASNIFTKFRRGPPPAGGAKYRSRSAHSLTLNISEMAKDAATVTMEGEQELVCYLSNGAISNEHERTLTLFSRSHHSLALNISQTAKDTAIITIEGE